MNDTNPKGTHTAQRQRSLKWGADGELSAVDLARVLERLQTADQNASTIGECPLSCGINDQVDA